MEIGDQMPIVKRKSRPPAEPRNQGATPLIAYGPHPFGPRDEADGMYIAGYRLRRAEDGQLVAIAAPTRRAPDA
jgi:hypothetical protein